MKETGHKPNHPQAPFIEKFNPRRIFSSLVEKIRSLNISLGDVNSVYIGPHTEIVRKLPRNGSIEEDLLAHRLRKRPDEIERFLATLEEKGAITRQDNRIKLVSEHPS